MDTSTVSTARNLLPTMISAYMLPRDDAERQRLELQHHLLKDLFDGRLLAERIKLESGWKVLDSGTGSGVWTLDLVSQAPPDVTFCGIDIASQLFPPSPPTNVTFLQQSILTLPESWTGTFDLIHQRLLLSALRTPEWRAATVNMLKALKPGGYVQLIEIGRMQTCGPGSASERAWEVLRELFRERDVLHDCYRDIPMFLSQAGFTDIQVEEKPVEFGGTYGEKGSQWLWDFLEVMRAIKPSVVNTKGLSWSGTEQDFDDLLKAAEKEWNETPGLVRPFYWYTARKPLA